MDNDEVDSCSDIGEDPEGVLTDGEVDTFVLYADIDPADTAAIARRTEEWEKLFGELQ